MHLATDYVHPTLGRGRCRVRVLLPDDPERDVPVVVCSELPANKGQSVTNAAERIRPYLNRRRCDARREASITVPLRERWDLTSNRRSRQRTPILLQGLDHLADAFRVESVVDPSPSLFGLYQPGPFQKVHVVADRLLG